MKRHLKESEINFVLDSIKNCIPKTRVVHELRTEHRTFDRMLLEHDIIYPIFRKRIVHENPFKEINSPSVQYWLGWLATDGHIDIKENRIRLSVSEKDEDIIIKFRDFVNPKLTIHKALHHNKYIQVYVSFRNKDIVGFLVNNANFCENKTFNYFPNFKITKDYVRGAFEGDGYLRWGDTKEFSIVGANKLHIEIIKDWITENGFNPKFHMKHDKLGTEYYEVALYRKNEIQSLLDLIYEDADTYLERKYQLARLVRNDERKGPKFGETASATPSQALETISKEGVTTLRGPLNERDEGEDKV